MLCNKHGWKRWALWLLISLLAGCSNRAVRLAPRVHQPEPRHSGTYHSSGTYDDIHKAQALRYRSRHDSVPLRVLFNIDKIPEPIPKPEPHSLYGNKSPYKVLGRTYKVLPTARGYDRRGIASFYGSKFQGYKTSNLETYDMYKFTAAHKTLPLPSYVRVTNLANGKRVIVRINDRGPFYNNRLIDLSFAAAVKIGIWPKGTGWVEVQGIDPASLQEDTSKNVEVPVQAMNGPPRQAYKGLDKKRDTNATVAFVSQKTTPMAVFRGSREPSPPVPSVAADHVLPTASVANQEPSAALVVSMPAAKPLLYVQVGAFASVTHANRIAAQLRAARITPVHVVRAQVDGRRVERVRVGPLTGVKKAHQVSTKIEAIGLPKPRITIN